MSNDKLNLSGSGSIEACEMPWAGARAAPAVSSAPLSWGPDVQLADPPPAATPDRTPAAVQRLRRRWPWLALAVAVPLLLWPGPWSVLGGVVAAPAVVYPLVRRESRLLSSRLAFPTTCLLLLTVLALLISPHPAQSLPSLYRFSLGWALFCTLHHGGTEKVVRGSLMLLSAAGAGLALVALVATDWSCVRLLPFPFYAAMPRVPLDLGQLFNPRIAGMTLAMLLPAPLALLLFAAGRRKRLLSAATALLMAAVLLLTQSPQAVLGLAAACLLLAAWKSCRALVASVLTMGLIAGLGLCLLDSSLLATSLFTLDHPLGYGVLLRLDA